MIEDNPFIQYAGILENRQRIRAILLDLFPNEKVRANVLVIAYDSGIASAIQNSNLLDNTFELRFVKILETEYAIQEKMAKWAVQYWMEMYGVQTLGKESFFFFENEESIDEESQELLTTEQGNKRREEIAKRRKQYVEKLGASVRIIVNNGIHFFFKDDEKQVFGIDESGKTYSFSGLHSVMKFKDCISFLHKDSSRLCVGKDNAYQDTTVSLDPISINKIYAEMMPILRKNLQVELDKYGVSPTHEYELDGEIWGCDTNSKQFYCVCGCPRVFNFSDLQRVTIDDLRNNTLYDGCYIIHVYVKDDGLFGFGDEEFEIHIKSPDTTYHNLLAMFKGIRNRQ